MSGDGEITRLLGDWSTGNQAALDRLLPLVYEELRRVARNHMRRERPDALLQTTALVHEAYLRLVDCKQARWQTRAHFFAVAAQVMRHILIDYARGRERAKRGGGLPEVPLHDVAVLSEARADELLAVHGALGSLTALDPRKAKVFELRY